ncbi:MAG: hypothetical protein AAF840_08805 [Bacteroidota bacterium]
MPTLTKTFLVGKWTHADWSLELTMFNYLVITWPNGAKAYGAWVLREDEVLLTYHHEGKGNKNIYLFAVEEILDENRISTRDVERNKEEVLVREV